MKANEILFRGVDVENEERLIYFALSDVAHGYDDGSCLVFLPVVGDTCDDYTVKNIQRYTGVNDINGKPIYEGDILRDELYSDYLFRVEFDTGNGFFFLRSNMRFRGVLALNHNRIIYGHFKIIGNTTENPELWKGGDE